MSTYFYPLFSSFLVCILMVSIAYLFSQIFGKISIIDLFWGPTISASILVPAFFIEKLEPITKISLFLVILWATRLTVQLFLRSLPVKEDDKRYIRITANYKSRYEVFLKIFLVQAVLAFLVSLTLHPSTYFNDRLEINYYLLAAGIFIYAVGLFVESWADWTLWRFKIKNPEKKLCKEGPWAWSRHPNYFGEMLIWWGLFLAFAIHSEWYISLIGPVLITFLLTKVSGAPLIETDKKNDAEYQKYISQTNKYFPNPFKKGVSNERY